MRKYLLYVIVVLMIVFAASAGYAQNEANKSPAKEGQVQTSSVEQAPAAPAPVAAQAAIPAKEEAPKMSELSIYGEVQNVNAQAGSMTVQYYDYDNDEEKSTEIALDSNSKLENAKAIGDIKKGDWVDLTYMVNAGKNVAKMVSVEKEEPAQEEVAPAADE